MLSVTKYCLFACLLVGNMFAQELPPIDVFYPDEYGGENQNWSVSQSADKYIYVANDKGLLEFNGAKWQLYPSPNNTIMRSVRVINDKIYTGCYMEFGFWESDNFGQLKYNSISQKLTKPLIEDEQFWNIISLDDWILFQSLNRIIIYNHGDSSYSTIDSETTLTKMFKVDESIYFQKINDGIYKIENGSEKLVSDNSIFQENIIVSIFNHNNKLLVLTQEKGFFLLEDDFMKPWDIPANEFLQGTSVYNCIQLKDKSYALGTISNGIIHLSAEGIINYQINQSKGLGNNTVLSLFEDIDNNIWLGLDDGINCVNISSPFSVYNDEKGEIGTVYASAIHNETLYLGTNQGLFSKNLKSKNNFKFIKGTNGQVWCLKKIDDTLFCGHNTGTFIISDDKVEKISDVLGVWNIQRVPGNDNLLIQGNYNGLNILERKNNTWQFKNKIEGFDISSRYFEFLNQDKIFVSHEYKGVFKINVNDSLTKANSVTQDLSVVKGLNSSLIKYNEEILYTNKEGIFKFDETLDKFKKDTHLSTIFNNQKFTSGKLVVDQKTNSIWSFTDKGLSYSTPGKLSNLPNINTVSILHTLRNSMTGYENIMHFENNKYLLCTTTGYIIIDLAKLNDRKFDITINSISKNKINKPQQYLNKDEFGSFQNDENNIEFISSIPTCDFDNVNYEKMFLNNLFLVFGDKLSSNL